MTRILALTGSMATGKSTVLDMLAQLGLPVFSADQAVHEIYRGPAIAPLEAEFGPLRGADGAIDRQKLAAILTQAPEKLSVLEKIVHPLVFAQAQNFIERQADNGVPLAVLEIPLLFETKNGYRPEWVAATWCSDALQRQRALARPGMTVEKLEAMLARQLPQAEKKRRADFLIDTGAQLEDTRRQVRAMLAAIRTGAAPPRRYEDPARKGQGQDKGDNWA